ncbi:unnamed protein product, partial [marine sediment metagenome]
LDEKAFFATINQVETLSLRTYGMTVIKIHELPRFFYTMN